MPPKNSKGFSLIELLIGIALLGIILTAVYQLFIHVNKSRVAQDLEVEMQQNARSAADFLVREMRNIYSISCMGNIATGCTTACATAGDVINFTSMADTPPTITRIFAWSSNTLLFTNNISSTSRTALADNITAFTLSPVCDANNNVQRIDIAITAQTSRVDPNTNNYRTYTIKTSVEKRN